MSATVRRLRTDTGVEIADHVVVARSMLRRGVGLMFRRALPEGHGLWIEPCNSIHMFFMRFAIDAVFVDRNGRVLRIYTALRPWRITRIVRGARTCIELPAGTLAHKPISKGDVLQLTD